MSVSKRLRFEILRRDNHTCKYCGATGDESPLTIDHVVPTALGGSDDPTNLVAACKDCNAGKSSIPPGAHLVEGVSKDALRWAIAMEIVAQGRAVSRMEAAERHDAFHKRWTDWKWTNSRGEK